MSLVAIIAWHSRCVVSWALEQTLERSFVHAALNQAFIKGKPDIINEIVLTRNPIYFFQKNLIILISAKTRQYIKHIDHITCRNIDTKMEFYSNCLSNEGGKE